MSGDMPGSIDYVLRRLGLTERRCALDVLCEGLALVGMQATMERIWYEIAIDASNERDAARRAAQEQAEEIARLKSDAEARKARVDWLKATMETRDQTLDNTQAALGRAVAALRNCIDVMRMQMKRETEEFHIPVESAAAAWEDALRAGDAILADPTCAAAGEAWREMEAVYQAAKAMRTVDYRDAIAQYADLCVALAAVDARRGP